MKYVVTRTSNYGEEDPKVKGVHKEILPFTYKVYHDKLTTGEELRETYTIEISSLEELHQLIKDCRCPVVISNPSIDGWGFQMPEIKIYDDYRE